MRAMPALLVALALCCATAAAQDDPGMHVRGAFNGWSADHPLRPAAPGVFETDIRIGPGYHGFKLGSADWSREWVIDPAVRVRVEAGRDYALAQHGGAEDLLLVPRAGRYRFTLDLRAAEARLRVMRLENGDVAAADPHAGRAAMELRYPASGADEVARFSLAEDAALRRYVHTTNAPLRDPLEPVARYAEHADAPRLRSGSIAFDALFALAVDEMRQDAVDSIRDDAYDGGRPQPCICFATGEKWPYVWTRDLAYAAHLGLVLFDPLRVKNGLLFKLSGWRGGLGKPVNAAGSEDGLQIVQDTGTGGSWPVSSDRVSWAYGAAALLAVLQGEERREFAHIAYRALVNTLENDRRAVYDAADGLYRGEQSFLDWREQSYAAWITGDLASLASSKALSTNAAHYRALRLAAQLAQEFGERGAARRYDAWAARLKVAMRTRFAFASDGLPATLIAGHFDAAPLQKHDWLALTLALEAGIFDADEARRIVSRYPHGPYGPPVLFPQQPDVPVYHNRALWPFVTAQGLRAAAQAKHVAAADAAYASLVRGAALNLSNMENLEWQSGHAMLLDEQRPELSGPVIDSRRQLWSVGAYLGMVAQQVFGISAQRDGLRVAPFLTARLRRDMFGDGIARLQNLQLGGHKVEVVLKLPPRAAQEGYYPLRTVRVNGRRAGAAIAWQALDANNVIELEFGALVRDGASVRVVRSDPLAEDAAVQAPREAGLQLNDDGRLVIVAAPHAAAAVRYALYRDGRRVAAGLLAGRWHTRPPAGCYSVEAIDTRYGLHAHRSAPLCTAPTRFIGVADLRMSGQAADWGAPGDTLELPTLPLARGGKLHVQLAYRNASHAINLGITSGVKWLRIVDTHGRVVAQGALAMPHALSLARSTPLSTRLPAGTYRVQVGDFYNMSYLQANARYGQAGGVDGARNRVEILGLLLRQE